MYVRATRPPMAVVIAPKNNGSMSFIPNFMTTYWEPKRRAAMIDMTTADRSFRSPSLDTPNIPTSPMTLVEAIPCT